MKLFEIYGYDILEEDIGSDAARLVTIGSALYQTTLGIVSKLQKGLQNEDPWAGAALEMARFVGEYNLRSKSGGSGFQDISKVFLKRGGRDVYEKFKHYTEAPVNMDRSANNRSSATTLYGNMAMFFMNAVPAVLAKSNNIDPSLAKSLTRTSKGITSAIPKMIELNDASKTMRSDIKSGDYTTGDYDNEQAGKADPNANDPFSKALRAKQQAKAEKEKDLRGGQMNQAETVVNQVLQSLDPKVAASIRQEISRAGNKLQALQMALKKRGIKM